MSDNEAKEEAQVIIEEFSFLDDWEDRYQLLIDQEIYLEMILKM